MVEFTMSWGERTEEFHEPKKTKYQDLAYSWRESCCKTAVFLLVTCCMFSISISIENAGDISGREWKIEAHAVGKLHKEHPVWLWLRPSEPNWKPPYVDEVEIGQQSVRHSEDISSIRGRNIWWRMETQLMASTFSTDIYTTIHVIGLQT